MITKQMYSREKLTIKGRASRRVFPSKNALQTKRPVFYSPGEFTGRRSETHRHKRKVEILRFRAKRELSSNLPPKRKNRPEDRSAENQENGRPFFYFPEKFSPPQTGEFFESQKEEHFHFSKNSPGETGTSFCLKKEFEHRENGRKEIRTSDLYS